MLTVCFKNVSIRWTWTNVCSIYYTNLNFDNQVIRTSRQSCHVQMPFSVPLLAPSSSPLSEGQREDGEIASLLRVKRERKCESGQVPPRLKSLIDSQLDWICTFSLLPTSYIGCPLWYWYRVTYFTLSFSFSFLLIFVLFYFPNCLIWHVNDDMSPPKRCRPLWDDS